MHFRIPTIRRASQTALTIALAAEALGLVLAAAAALWL